MKPLHQARRDAQVIGSSYPASDRSGIGADILIRESVVHLHERPGDRSRSSEHGPPAAVSARPLRAQGGPEDPDIGQLVAALIGPQGGFAAALGELYDVDLNGAFDQVLCLDEVGRAAGRARRRWLPRGAGHRRCRSLLGRDGVVAAWPGHREPRASNEAIMAACQLLGSSGFAQLCDPLLGRSVPLFVRPWVRDRGLVPPARLPAESFSRALAVLRLAPGRMILLDKHAARRDNRLTV